MSARSEIVDLLRSDLYKRVTLSPGAYETEEFMLWRSPLGWEVSIYGPRDEPAVSVNYPDGSILLHRSPMTAEALDGILP